jgi:hypothetical protein
MKSLNETGFKGLKWVQRSSKEDELVSEDDVVGVLHWASSWSSLAIAESADGKWSFKRIGFIHPKISIREFGKDVDLYFADIGWGGEATLILPDQGAFRWTPHNWHRKWILQDKEGKEIMSIELDGIVKVNGKVTIDHSSIPTPTLSLLVLLGWHLIMNVLSDEAASTAAVV